MGLPLTCAAALAWLHPLRRINCSLQLRAGSRLPPAIIYLPPRRRLPGRLQWLFRPTAGRRFHSFVQHVTKDLRGILCAISSSSSTPITISILVFVLMPRYITRLPGRELQLVREDCERNARLYDFPFGVFLDKLHERQTTCNNSVFKRKASRCLCMMTIEAIHHTSLYDN